MGSLRDTQSYTSGKSRVCLPDQGRSILSTGMSRHQRRKTQLNSTTDFSDCRLLQCNSQSKYFERGRLVDNSRRRRLRRSPEYSTCVRSRLVGPSARRHDHPGSRRQNGTLAGKNAGSGVPSCWRYSQHHCGQSIHQSKPPTIARFTWHQDHCR